MSESFDTHYWSGQGPVFLGSRDANGDPAGLEFIGDVASVEITANVGRTDVIENVTGARNIGASFIDTAEYAISINMKSVKAAHLARAIGGDVTTKAAGSVTDEAVTGYHDKFTPLANVKVSTVVVTNDTGVTTYVADTDYVVHADEGMIEILSTGSITDGQALLVDYDYAAQKKVSSNYANADLVLVCPAMNRARDNKRGRLTVHKVNLDPSALSAIQDGNTEASMTLGGKVVLDSTKAAGNQLYSWDMED